MYNASFESFEVENRGEYITPQSDGVLGGAILQEFDRIMNADPAVDVIAHRVDVMQQLQSEPAKAEYIPPDHDCSRCAVNAATCTLLEMANTNSVFADRIQAVSDLKKNGEEVSNEAIKQRMQELKIQRESALIEPQNEKQSIPPHIAEMMKKRAQVVKVEPIAKPVEVIIPPKTETISVISPPVQEPSVPIEIHVPSVEVVVLENQKPQPVFVETIQASPIIETVPPVIHDNIPQPQESHESPQEVLTSAPEFSNEPRQIFEVQENPPYGEKFQPDQPERNIDIQVRQAELILKTAIAESEKPKHSDITKKEPLVTVEQFSEQVIQVPVKKEGNIDHVIVENTTIFVYNPQHVVQERRDSLVVEPSITQNEKLVLVNDEKQDESVEKNHSNLDMEVSEEQFEQPFNEQEDEAESEGTSLEINHEISEPETPLVSFIDSQEHAIVAEDAQDMQRESLALDYLFDETSFEDVTILRHQEIERGDLQVIEEIQEVGEDLSWLPEIEFFYEEENILVACDEIINPIFEISAFYKNPNLGVEVSESLRPVFEIDFSQVVIPRELTCEPVVRDSFVEEFKVEEPDDGVIDVIEDSVVKQFVEDVKEFFEKSVDDSNVFESDPLRESEHEENLHILEIKKVLTELLWCVEIVTLLGNKTVRRELTEEMAGNNSLLYKYMLQASSDEEMKKDPQGNVPFIPDENVNFLLFFWVVSTGLRKVFSFSSVKKNIITS